MGTSSIITFSDPTCQKPKVVIEKAKETKNSLIGEIKVKLNKKFFCRDRDWLWFPLVMTAECWMKTPIEKLEFVKTYPRIIQWTDGKYYVFAGTHSKDERYNIKGDEMVYYKEVLISEGEKLEYIALDFSHFKQK